MEADDQSAMNDEFAGTYDDSVDEYGYHPEMLSGLCFEYVKKGDRLLDIGIGTGLASLNFAKFGVEVHGIDSSNGMLDVCRSKDFAVDLKKHDLRDLPLPCADNSFDHVMSSGVFHFFDDLNPIFREVARIIRPEGMFAFIVRDQAVTDGVTEDDLDPDGYVGHDTHYGVKVYMHGEGYIGSLIESCGFECLKEFKFLLASGLEGLDDFVFKAYVTQKSA